MDKVRALNTRSGTEITMSQQSWDLCKSGARHLQLINEQPPEDLPVKADFITVTEIKATEVKPEPKLTNFVEVKKTEKPKAKRNRKPTPKKQEAKNDTGK